ncbi:MAG: metallophosphoesterase [Muribaculaceae bacterium]|nr:metallophosphoesterase [Muribaculaceae bacterium]
MTVFFIMFIGLGLLLLLPDAYIIFGVLGNASWWWKVVFFLPTLALYFVIIKIFVLGDMRQGAMNWLFWLSLLVFLPVFIFAIISLIGKGIVLFWSQGSMVFNWIALGITCLWLIIAIYGITVGWKKITVEKVTIASSKIPESFNDYKIVQLSDFHIGTYASSPKTVEKIVRKVNSLNPDLIVFTGDLVNTSSSEINQFEDVLSQLKAKDGVLSVLGNHDYCLYKSYVAPDSPEKELSKVVATEKKVGWQLLRNDQLQIKRGNDSIAIIGVENAGGESFTDRADLKKALSGVPENEFKILLSHDPSHWRREVLPKSDIDLMLAGHTHAMQFKIGNWSPSKYSYPEWGGLYKEGNQQLYVSTGIGENVAFRFGAYPQIVLIDLKRE